MYEMILLIILRPILVIEYKCYLKNMQNMQNEISFSKTTLEIAACSTCYSTINRMRSIGREKSAVFKKWKNNFFQVGNGTTFDTVLR